MSNENLNEHIGKSIFEILGESFEKVDGIFLDRGTALLETLAGLSAQQASIPIPGGASIAAHVFHICFYIDVSRRYMRGENLGKIDWQKSWDLRTVNEVEWAELRQRLEKEYMDLANHVSGTMRWEGERNLDGMLAILVHTAYHLGAIRQIIHIAK